MGKTLEKLCEEAISLCIHTRCNLCEYGGRTLLPREGQRCQGKLLADYLRNHGVVVQRWIPVAEQLPEKRSEVIACILHRFGDKSVIPMMFNSEKQFGWQDVTHWMPLPEPPQEGQ